MDIKSESGPGYRTGLRILDVTIGIEAESRRLLPRFPLRIEVPSLLTDFHDVESLPPLSRPDGRIVIEDIRSPLPEYAFSGRTAVFRGLRPRHVNLASDLRYTLYGNQGFVYRFALSLLESRRAIFSFHAAGLVDESRGTLYVVAGGPGSGKTVFCLSGLDRGLKLFSTETVHVRLSAAGPQWFKGSLVDNIRAGTLVRDFPNFKPAGFRPISTDGMWREKIAVDLSALQTADDALDRPPTVLIFPRIEDGRKGFESRRYRDPRRTAQAVFYNISQKIAETVILYDRWVVPGFDRGPLARARFEAAKSLAAHPSLRAALTVLANPRDCWGTLLESPKKEVVP